MHPREDTAGTRRSESVVLFCKDPAFLFCKLAQAGLRHVVLGDRAPEGWALRRRNIVPVIWGRGEDGSAAAPRAVVKLKLGRKLATLEIHIANDNNNYYYNYYNNCKKEACSGVRAEATREPQSPERECSPVVPSRDAGSSP